MHTLDELWEGTTEGPLGTKEDPLLGSATAHIKTLVSARRPSEATQVDLERNDEDSNDPEVRRMARRQEQAGSAAPPRGHFHNPRARTPANPH